MTTIEIENAGLLSRNTELANDVTDKTNDDNENKFDFLRCSSIDEESEE